MSKSKIKIYTRTGDNGTTSLYKGGRISKASARIHAIGEMDEINCLIGMVIANSDQKDLNEMLVMVQHGLFNIGANLASDHENIMVVPDATRIESMIDELSDTLPPLSQFILPGGSPVGALTHLARAVCRRAERCLVELQDQQSGIEEAITFVNRVSDLLFVMARALNQRLSSKEINWNKGQW